MRKFVVFAVKNSVETVKIVPCFSTIRYKWTSCDKIEKSNTKSTGFFDAGPKGRPLHEKTYI